MRNKIEILSTDILNEKKYLVDQFRNLSLILKKGLGWHYLLDLAWAASHMSPSQNKYILDAGAGYGIMQWWLVEQGVNIISVDKLNRLKIPDNFQNRYNIKGWCKKDLSPNISITDLFPSKNISNIHLYPSKFFNTIRRIIQTTKDNKEGGTLYIHQSNLAEMNNIPSKSIDDIVSISSLEHNSPEELRKIVNELIRVLKPGGKIVATLGASKGKDWLHKPSNGWCFTEQTLRDVFDLPTDCESNFEKYDELFKKIKDCLDLSDNLADFYYESGENGMPWGVWDPKYLPVGIVKFKT